MVIIHFLILLKTLLPEKLREVGVLDEACGVGSHQVDLQCCISFWCTAKWFSQLYIPVGRYLGCFHVLAIVNSAAMNIGVHVSFQTKFSLDIYPGVGLLDHMVTLFLVFRGTSILFSICVCSVAQLCTTLCDPTDCSL